MEEVGVGFLRVIFHFCKWLLIEAFVDVFLYGYGYVTLKVLTLGKYPKANRDNQTLCIVTGFVSAALTLVLLVSLAGLYSET